MDYNIHYVFEAASKYIMKFLSRTKELSLDVDIQLYIQSIFVICLIKFKHISFITGKKYLQCLHLRLFFVHVIVTFLFFTFCMFIILNVCRLDRILTKSVVL